MKKTKKKLTLVSLQTDKSSFIIETPNPVLWFKNLFRKEKCLHEDWDMDSQIRLIRCRDCGKEAWVREYRNLFDKK